MNFGNKKAQGVVFLEQYEVMVLVLGCYLSFSVSLPGLANTGSFSFHSSSSFRICSFISRGVLSGLKYLLSSAAFRITLISSLLSWVMIPSMVSAFGIFLCRQFCEDIPNSLCESAIIDGADDFRIFWQIIIPQLRPCIGALAIFTFLGVWNDYMGPLIMLAEVKNMTLPLALSYFSTQHSNDIGAVMAASSLIMIPVTIVFLCFQSQFIKGITLTGIK